MKIDEQVVDTVILSELGERIARLRLERNLKQVDLATQAGVSKRTVERMEGGGPTQLANLVRVCRALGLVDRFEMLIPQPLPSPVEQLKLRGRQRKRAASVKTKEPAGKWTWGEDAVNDAAKVRAKKP